MVLTVNGLVNYVLISFDVVALFNNTPLKLCIDVIRIKLDPISPHCKLPLLLISLISCLKGEL